MNTLSKWVSDLSSADDVITKTHKPLSSTSIYRDDTKPLATDGVGTLWFRLEKMKAFNVDLIAINALIRLSVSKNSVKFYCIYRGRLILLKEDFSGSIGLDHDPKCAYWLSFQAHTRTVSYGKHKPSFQNTALGVTLPKSNKPSNQYWMNKIGRYRVDSPAIISLSKVPVVTISTCRAENNQLATRI